MSTSLKLPKKQPLRSGIITAILLNSFGLGILPVLANPIPAATEITSKATGVFVDEVENETVSIESNTVKITVAEVAGIGVVGSNVQEAPSGVSGAGPNQGNGFINRDDIVYFDFTITNTGNDPTQFAIPIPDSSQITNADLLTGQVQIIGYSADSLNAPIDLTADNIFVTTSGQTTGTLLNGVANTNDGSVPSTGSIVVRIPVKVNSNLPIGSSVTVLFGNSPEDSDSTDDPKARLQNQAHMVDSDQDDYTVDNPGTTNGDIDGAPINGVREASAIMTSSVVISGPYQVSGRVFEDINYGGGNGRVVSCVDATTNLPVTGVFTNPGPIFVGPRPTAAVSASPATIAAGAPTTLTYTLSNTTGFPMTLTSAFSNTLPAGMTIVGASPGGTCTGVTATTGSNTVTMANGTQIPNGGCTITVSVASSVSGTRTVSVPAGAFAVDGGLTNAATSANLTVTPSPQISVSKTIPSGRAAASDQFDLALRTGGSGGTQVATATTSGTGSTVTGGISAFTGVTGTAYTITEAMASGSGAVLGVHQQDHLYRQRGGHGRLAEQCCL